MGNCLAPFQLTGQSNLFHVMALFTCLTKLHTCKASELIYVDEIDQEIPNLCLQTSVHIQQQHLYSQLSSADMEPLGGVGVGKL